MLPIQPYYDFQNENPLIREHAAKQALKNQNCLSLDTKNKLLNIWNELKNSSKEPGFVGLMLQIETDDNQEPDPCTCFTRLNREVSYPGSITGIFSYCHAYQMWEDEAIKILWQVIILERTDVADLRDNNFDEILMWFENPKNEPFLKSIKHISLAGMKLKLIPPQLMKCSNLEKFTASDNHIYTIPDWISSFSFLKKLDLNDCQLSILPDSFAFLKSLEEVVLQDNYMSTFPECICKLPCLKRLDISENQLTDLPASFKDLKQLEHLNLSQNELTHLPESIRTLFQLKNINFKDNSIETIPDWIGELTNLTKLHFCNNKISKIPSSIGGLSKLQKLCLFANQIDSIPEELGSLLELEELKLGDNNITKLPDTLCDLKKLTIFDLEENTIEPPKWVDLVLERNKLLLLARNNG